MKDIRLALLLGEKIKVGNLCVVKPIKISDISDPEQYEKYIQYLTIISYNTDDVIDLYQAKKEYDSFSPDAQSKITAFGLLISVEYFRNVLGQALQFFIEEELEYDESLKAFFVYRGKRKAATINQSNYNDVRSVILEMNHMKNERAENEHVFANSKAKAIFEKLKNGRKKKVENNNIPLVDIISAVSVQSNTYNLFNIGGLTIYQLYDQFSRLDAKSQIDVYGLKWAAWGTEPFDFSMWYKNNK